MLTKRHYVFGTILAGAGLMLVCAYAISMSLPAAGIFHDDGIYLVTARSLAEGHGYRIISLPDSPPQTKYPILFPWLLSWIWRIAPVFPDNLPLLRIVPVASAVVWLWLSWRLLRTCGIPRPGVIAVVALTAASPWVLFLSTSFLSETLFAALLTGSLLLLTKVHADSSHITRICALAGVLAGACVLTRTAGIAVVAAGFGWLLISLGRRASVVFGAAAASLVIPWVLWVLLNSGADSDPYYSASIYGKWNVVAYYGWHEKLEVMTRNVLNSITTPLALWSIEGSVWTFIAAVLLAGCVCRGAWLTRSHPVTWFVAIYVAMITLWVWPPTRFYIPLVPLFLWHVLVAIRRVPVMPVAILAAVIMLTSSAALWRSVIHARAEGVLWPRAEFAEDWYRLSTLFEWIHRETPPGSVLTGNLDPTYFLYTGRKGVRAFTADPYALFYGAGDRARAPLGSVDDFRHRLLSAGVDYCVWSPAPAFGESPHLRRLIEELAHEVPGSVTIATGNEASGYVVYRIDRAKLAEDERRRAS